MHQSDCRQRGVRLLLPLLTLLIAVPALAAQEPADTTRPSQDLSDSLPDPDSSVITESPSRDSAAAAAIEDTVDVVRRRPSSRAPRGSNPYLREVDEPATRHERGRYYATVAIGAGSEAIASLGPGTPFSPSRTRPTLNAGVGFNVGQQLRIGVDGFGWFNGHSDGTLETVTALLVGGRVYPFPRAGLYLRAAGGVGIYDIGDYDWNCGCTVNGTTEVGLAWSLGGGIEFPISRSLSLGPTAEVVRFNVTGPGGYRERVVNLGLSLMVDTH